MTISRRGFLQGAAAGLAGTVVAKGAAAVTFKGKMVDTPVYENALTILRTMNEIKAADAKRK